MKNERAVLISQIDFEQKKNRVTQQFWEDTAFLTLYEEFGLDYDFINRFLKAWEENRKYWKKAADGGMESDVWQTLMDREFHGYMDGHQEVVPFDVRYPEIKQYGYDKRVRRWFD